MSRTIALPKFKKYKEKNENEKLGDNQFKIPRYKGYEEAMNSLVGLITGNDKGYKHGGCEFENSTFSIFPYYFGGCQCSIHKLILEFDKSHKHTEDCFHTHWLDIKTRFEEHKEYFHSNLMKTHRRDSEIRLCKLFNLSWNSGKNIEKICTCEYQTELDKLVEKNPHDSTCPVVRPNFHYFAEDVKIWWYKTYFRDAYSNVPLKLDKFRSIILDCNSSI